MRIILTYNSRYGIFMVKGFLKELLRLHQTVFSFNELTLLWPDADATSIRSRVHYYIKHGDLYRIRRGLYAKDQKYDRFELATKIMSPAYISFETVLVLAGIVFQHYDQVFVASYQSKSIVCDGQTYTFKKIKPSILLNSAGIEIKENYSIATAERAFLDIIYLHKDYYFDNLAPLHWDKVYEILPLYDDNKRMKKIVDENYKSVKKAQREGQ